MQSGNDPLYPWSGHALGGALLSKLVNQYLRRGDIQTVAMLVCTAVVSFQQHQPQPTAKVKQHKPGLLLVHSMPLLVHHVHYPDPDFSQPTNTSHNSLLSKTVSSPNFQSGTNVHRSNQMAIPPRHNNNRTTNSHQQQQSLPETSIGQSSQPSAHSLSQANLLNYKPQSVGIGSWIRNTSK